MPTIDEKKAIIVPLLEAFKQFNPHIGNYEKSILNGNFQYAVKLSNGRLLIPQETIHDYEQSPSFVTEDQLKFIALTFVPSNATNFNQTISEATPAEKTSVPDTSVIYSSQPKQPSSMLKKILILSGIVVLGLVGYFVYEQINKEHQATQAEDDKNQIRNSITNYITAETNQYQYSELGGIYNLVVTIRNATAYMMENVRITLTYIKANGGVWKNQDYDFEMLSPHSKGTIKVPNTSRGTSVKVRVTAVRSTALGLQ